MDKDDLLHKLQYAFSLNVKCQEKLAALSFIQNSSVLMKSPVERMRVRSLRVEFERLSELREEIQNQVYSSIQAL